MAEHRYSAPLGLLGFDGVGRSSYMANHIIGSFMGLVNTDLRFESLALKPLISTSVGDNKRKFQSPNNRSTLICYKCRKKGHFSNRYRSSGEGWMVISLNEKILKLKAQFAPEGCYGCHRPGHFVRDCPMLKKGEQHRVFVISATSSPWATMKGKQVIEGIRYIYGFPICIYLSLMLHII